MSSPTLQFSCALITGGGSGIGFALAKWLLSTNKKVIIVGRTESKLQSASKDLNNCPYYTLDTGNIPSIPSILKQITTEHPKIDCLINNAGVQRPLDINNFDLSKADQEIDINIRGPLRTRLHPHVHHQPGLQRHQSLAAFLDHEPANPAQRHECEGCGDRAADGGDRSAS